jgi:hypothetical protein
MKPVKGIRKIQLEKILCKEKNTITPHLFRNLQSLTLKYIISSNSKDFEVGVPMTMTIYLTNVSFAFNSFKVLPIKESIKV